MDLRVGSGDDEPAMRRLMHPYRNAFLPGSLMEYEVRVAEVDGEVVGFVGWRGSRILALYVAEAWRGRREVGTALLAEAESAIRRKDFKEIRVMVDADASPAQRFYLRHDYEPQQGRDHEDFVWMTKRL